ncbi:hypothetical protein LCGC14_0534990 [marine sediment metagenome]|uniref:Uncharacterized protein n=1 Tax=marine sediment metagenome TaxID=412755 RepID=A0A0F9UFW4_9ZZZZ
MTDKEKPRKKRLLDPINPSSQPLLDLRIEELKKEVYKSVLKSVKKWKLTDTINLPLLQMRINKKIDTWYTALKKELKGKAVRFPCQCSLIGCLHGGSNLTIPTKGVIE